ncbi:MAG TPA: hypothetical protein VJG32_09015 [Anaerolineae bacterium]|nr:hypothetical protein [Anaerolineae bacterium]
MRNQLLLGLGRRLLSIPPFIWQRQVKRNAQRARAGLGFMSDDHHRVRDFVVTELPSVGQPLLPGMIAQQLNLPPDRVGAILDDLERHLTFLFRNEAGAVVWAYPVAAAPTPHRFVANTGESLYAA